MPAWRHALDGHEIHVPPAPTLYIEMVLLCEILDIPQRSLRRVQDREYDVLDWRDTRLSGGSMIAPGTVGLANH